MDATPPPELANHEERITKLENAMTNLSFELQSLRAHMDCRFKEIETALNTLRIEMRAEFEAKLQAKLHEAVEKMHARMDAQHHLNVALQVTIFLALIALFTKG